MTVESNRRQMKIAVYMTMDGNYHFAGWRMPGAHADAGLNIERWKEAARIMERGRLDMLFIADSMSPVGADHLDSMSHSPRAVGFEPLTLLSALSGCTTHLGLAATAPTTWYEPYIVARQFASLDHLSGGRAGWNMVTGRNPEDALNFNRSEHVAHQDRYRRAEEFADVVRKLWDSYDDDAIVHDKASGRFFDPAKMRLINHVGEHFTVRGPLSVARPPQGRPVIIQAGESEPARQLSARAADVVFTQQSSLAAAQAFYADMKRRAATFGRAPDELKVFPGLNFCIGGSRQEAEEKYEAVQAATPIAYAVRQFGLLLGVDLSGHPLDGPMPQLEASATRANPERWLAFSRDGGLTLRQAALRATAAKAHWMVKGTAKDIADQMEAWFQGGAADGFNLLPPLLPDSLVDFVDGVVPELQRRGLFRQAYESHMLRDNLGLPRPANMFAGRRD
jgi:FMN-dependent oxidoreductase (nitrilotriacetate monooxygenase family)